MSGLLSVVDDALVAADTSNRLATPAPLARAWDTAGTHDGFILWYQYYVVLPGPTSYYFVACTDVHDECHVLAFGNETAVPSLYANGSNDIREAFPNGSPVKGFRIQLGRASTTDPDGAGRAGVSHPNEMVAVTDGDYGIPFYPTIAISNDLFGAGPVELYFKDPTDTATPATLSTTWVGVTPTNVNQTYAINKVSFLRA